MANLGETADDSLFWQLAAPLIAEQRVAEGIVMRSRCLRIDGEFLAMAERRSGDLIVKLPAGRVAELIAAGEGRAVAPAGKVFREWLQVSRRDEARWRELLAEGMNFVGGTAATLQRAAEPEGR